MKKIAILVVSILFYASVAPIVAETPEITEARIAGENDAKVFHWQWFAAGNLIIQATPIVLLSAGWFLEEVHLYDTLVYDININPLCCFAIYGIYALSPTAVALLYSPAPPADRLLGKSPDWVDAYTKAYQKHIRRYRAESSAVGCVVGTASLASTVYLMGAILGGLTPGDAD